MFGRIFYGEPEATSPENALVDAVQLAGWATSPPMLNALTGQRKPLSVRLPDDSQARHRGTSTESAYHRRHDARSRPGRRPAGAR